MSDYRESQDEARYEAMVNEPEGEPIAALPTRQGRTGQRSGTVEQLWSQRIEAGECPRGACSGSLDTEGYCSLCGFSLLSHRMRTRIVVREQAGDYLPRLPGALFIDEYAEANIDREAA